jgi:hypothetical protein
LGHSGFSTLLQLGLSGQAAIHHFLLSFITLWIKFNLFPQNPLD